MRAENKKKWSVFFIIKSVDDNIKYAIPMLNEIRSILLNSQISINFCITMHKENLPALLEGNVDLLVADGVELTPTTFILNMAIEKQVGKIFPSKFEVVDENEQFDITDPLFLKDYFRNEILAKHKATHYCLFTWDHGSAYGIFHDPQKEKFNSSFTNGFEIIVGNVPVLTMEELNFAIQSAFGKTKVDLIIMMNCFMQFIDAGYALSNSVKYMVAPQSSIDFNGYNYPFIFEVLLHNSNISPKELSKVVVKSFSQKVYADRLMGLTAKSETALFASDLRYYPLLAVQIDKLADILSSILPEKKEKIRSIKNKSICEPGRELVDLYTFINLLEQEKMFGQNTSCPSLILALKNQIFFEKCIGASSTRYSGLSIFFPNADSVRPRDGFTDFFETEFMKKTKWYKLLKATF